MTPSPQNAGKVVSSGPQVRRHLALAGEARLRRTISLVQGERISWFSLWPSLEYFDIRKRPFTNCWIHATSVRDVCTAADVQGYIVTFLCLF